MAGWTGQVTGQARTANGERIYAIGDVHGRIDLLATLLRRVHADSDLRDPAPTRIILLGDLVDRGPWSCALVQQMMTMTARTDRVVVLKGNHEDAMLSALDGDFAVLEAWLEIGGDATLESWGVPAGLLAERRLPEVLRESRQRVSAEEIAWLRALPLTVASGDYLFVHAGIRPGVPLRLQAAEDLLWIGPEFIDSAEAHPAVIVHGHTVSEHGPDIQPYRIGIDTGACWTGRLTAIGLQDTARWTLSSRD
jgi:serine/threonine protein phosphatase 1